MTEKRVPLRTCIACRNEKPKRELYRIVKNKDGDIFLDKTGKSDGRGAYICGKQECMQKLRKARLLNKIFKCEVPDSVYEGIAEAFNGVE